MTPEYSGRLNLNQSPSEISQKKCSCTECNNAGTVFLNIVRLPSSGYFCTQCCTDLKWHGIGEETVPVEQERFGP